MPPSDPPKLYLNEHLSPRLAIQLCRQGFDVTTSQGAKMLSQDDADQLALAASERRAIVTFNFADFMSLHEKYMAEGEDHWDYLLNRRAHWRTDTPIAPPSKLNDRKRIKEPSPLA